MSTLKEEKPIMIESAASVSLENPPARRRPSRLASMIAALSLLLAIVAPAPALAFALPGKKKPDAAADKSKATPPEEALKAYIQRVRTQHETEVRTPGSIWIDKGRLVRLSTDAKAVRLHDVVAIVVAESVAAETDGEVKNSRASNASSGFTGLFGNLSSTNRLQNLIGQNSASGLNAQGQSVTNSSLTTTFGAEVVDVLPNGMLVVQATRQLTFSQQTQLIKLRGLVRPEDVSAQNQVLSTAMTDLELEVTGKGIVNDTTYRQNPVWRFLQRLLIF
jgi:flagellar L-ring protein precursor FlgH